MIGEFKDKKFEERLLKENLTAVSLFDGISCGQQALKELRKPKGL